MSSDLSAAEIKEQIDKIQGQMYLESLQKMQESFALMDRMVDPREPYWDDPNGELWYAVHGGDPDQISSGFDNEGLLQEARRTCRVLALENGFAISGHENRESYVVGSGHQYTVRPKSSIGSKPYRRGKDTALDQLVDAVKSEIDLFAEINEWEDRQAENQHRFDRDGEVFIRMFPDRLEGVLHLRTIEPGLVVRSAGGGERDSFGIRTDADDVERIEGYWIDGQEFIPADQIQHRKANVDRNVKRGVPTFWSVRHNLDRAHKLLRNMSVVAALQASIGMIRKFENTTKDAFGRFNAGQEATSRERPRFGGNQSFEDWQTPGRIINSRGDVNYEFPIVGVNAEGFVACLDAELRSISARLVMPEWMFTANASNNNYASSLVSGSPSFKQFDRMQSRMKRYDIRLLKIQIQLAIDAGRLPPDTLDRIEIEATGPELENIDQLAQTKRNQVRKQEGVLSTETWCQLEGLDYETEMDNQRRHQEEYGDLMQDALPDEGGDAGGDGKSAAGVPGGKVRSS